MASTRGIRMHYVLKVKNEMFVSVDKPLITQRFFKSKEFALARRNADRILRELPLIKRLKETHLTTNYPTWEIKDLYSCAAVKQFFFSNKEVKKQNSNSGPTQILRCELYPAYHDYQDLKLTLETVAKADLATAIKRIEYDTKTKIKPMPSVFEAESIIKKLYEIKIELERSMERLDKEIQGILLP